MCVDTGHKLDKRQWEGGDILKGMCEGKEKSKKEGNGIHVT